MLLRWRNGLSYSHFRIRTRLLSRDFAKILNLVPFFSFLLCNRIAFQFSGGRAGGGSTITQQLVKNAVLSHERSIARKAAEAVLAIMVERRLSKTEILEKYLNRVYWGHGVYGITGAAAAYFQKHPGELTLGEGALLAAMLPAPELYSPFINPKEAHRYIFSLFD